MSVNQNRIVQIYKSRLNVLNILQKTYQYDVSDYSGFSVNEIDSMYNHAQLDMLLTNQKQEEDIPSLPIHKTYIKYFVSKGVLNASSLSEIIDDLYVYTNTLSKTDCLYIIYDGEPNDTLISHLNFIYERDKIFVVVCNIKRLQFNILDHKLVPKSTILSSSQAIQIKKQYMIDDVKQMPEISRYDPQALAICLRPGQICMFLRNSPTSLETPYYRICV